MPAPITSTAHQSHTPTPTLRFRGSGAAHEIFPAQHLYSVRIVDQFQRETLDVPAENKTSPNHNPEDWHIYEANMQALQDVFKNKTVYKPNIQEKLALLEKRHELVVPKYPQAVDQFFDGMNEDTFQRGGIAPAAPAASVEPGEEGKEEGGAKDDKDFKKQAAANWTPRNERTRPKVLMDLGKQYVTRGPLLSDSLWSLGIGAVLAIGSPVMAVTIPTTFAFFLAGRAALGLIHACQDPKGASINDKYQKWIEKDAEKLKAKESS